jgi:3-oxoacid CoA-transferase subunit A
MAGKVCVAEVEQIVEIGAIDPDQCTCPASTSTASCSMRTPEKRIEQRTVRQGDK